MFNLRDFVMKTLKDMAKNEPAYKVNKYALGWFEKEVLTVEDLAEVDSYTAILNEEQAEEIIEEPTEETPLEETEATDENIS
ncbi:MAG: hypothetical protein II978_08570 [Clostridia bacterium]|nr:hypothetical protein [Clostridia bacterium]